MVIRPSDASRSADRLHGILPMCFAGPCFAIMDSGVKALTREDPIPQLLWARYAIHVFLMIVLFGPRHRPQAPGDAPLDASQTARPLVLPYPTGVACPAAGGRPRRAAA